MSNVQRDLRYSFLDAVFFSLMVGLGETYLSAFALATGSDALTAGWVSTLPLVAGGIFQLFAPYGLRWLGSYKKWVITVALGQALVFAPLAIGSWNGYHSSTLLFLFASLYWGFGMAAGGAWNAWLRGLVPKELRISFFGARSRIQQAVLLGAVLTGGYLLQLGKNAGQLLETFYFLFIWSMAARLMSVLCLIRQGEGQPREMKLKTLGFKDLYRRLTQESYGRVLIYMSLLQVGAYFSAGFFSPYVLGQMNKSYNLYTLMLAGTYVAKILAFGWAKKHLKSTNVEKVFLVAAIGVIPLPVLWLVSEAPVYLIAVQILSGLAWGLHEMCMMLKIFDEVPDDESTIVLSAYHLLSTFGVMVGALAGGLLFKSMGQGLAAYTAVFVGSSLIRFTLFLSFPGVATSVHVRSRVFLTRSLGVRLGAGSIERPIVTGTKR